MELDFSKLPSGYPRIYGHEAKSDITSPQYGAVNAIVATELASEVRARLTMAGREAAYALKVQDYARVDIGFQLMGYQWLSRSMPILILKEPVPLLWPHCRLVWGTRR